MTISIDSLLNKKGQYVTFKTERPMKVRKGQESITKVSEFVARIGVVYDNMKSVIQKREDGSLPEENQGLPWGKWVKFPYLIEHKDTMYIRCSATKNSMQSGKVVYYRNGEEINVDEVKKSCLASEFSKSEPSDIFNVKVDSILEVH